MSFKDQIKQDLSDIFLNLDEFADLHRIEGKEVPVVIDSDIMAKLSKIGDNRIHGMDEADMVIMGKASDLPENLDPGRLLNLDRCHYHVGNGTRTDRGSPESHELRRWRQHDTGKQYRQNSELAH